MPSPLDLDSRLRLAVFAHLDHLRRISGGVVTAQDLNKGIEFEGRRVPIWSQPRGIYKPEILGKDGAALTIVTTATRPGRVAPYDDRIGSDDDWIAYRYRGKDATSYDNRALRRAHDEGVPLLYLFGIVPGVYRAIYPAYVVSDDPSTLTCHVSIGLPVSARDPLHIDIPQLAVERRYQTIAVKKRLHQDKFRALVLRAYRERCAMCLLKHAPLLDAAHILEDRDERGRPEVPNGLALCKIHHSAFDANILGIDPEYRVHVRQDILDEHDGPMLKYGLQGMEAELIHLPRYRVEWPRREYLEDRYERFVAA